MRVALEEPKLSNLLTVRDLVVQVPARDITIINGVSFSLDAGQTLGLVEVGLRKEHDMLRNSQGIAARDFADGRNY